MSTTSKSPVKVAQAAYTVAQATLPEYAHRFSPRKFTQPQLFVCLVLKTFFKTDYRGITELLNDCPDLCRTFRLKTVPHFTTLQKAERRLVSLKRADQLLEATVAALCKDKKVTLAALDSTGLEAGRISRYFVQRKRSKESQTLEQTTYRRFPRLAVVCDCLNHMILSMFTARGPSVDINQFCKTLKPAIEKVRIKHLLADAGYDSEANHQYARNVHHIKTTIPAKHSRPTTQLPKTTYRREMKTDFDKDNYGQRWQVETVFSMIKRNQGDALRARSYWAQNREMMLKVLTHNIGIILFVKELFYRAGQESFSSKIRIIRGKIKVPGMNGGCLKQHKRFSIRDSCHLFCPLNHLTSKTSTISTLRPNASSSNVVAPAAPGFSALLPTTSYPDSVTLQSQKKFDFPLTFEYNTHPWKEGKTMKALKCTKKKLIRKFHVILCNPWFKYLLFFVFLCFFVVKFFFSKRTQSPSSRTDVRDLLKQEKFHLLTPDSRLLTSATIFAKRTQFFHFPFSIIHCLRP